MAKILGILNLHNEPSLGDLTSRRSLGAVTFLGRYAFCDVALSNFGNSKINTTAILVKKNFRTIIRHIDNSKLYCENSKLGTLYMLYNEQYANEELYNTDINNLIENRWLIEEKNVTHVVIAPTHLIYKLDFRDVLKQHMKMNSEITVIYKHIENGKTEFTNCNTYIIDENKHLKGIYVNKGERDSVNVSLDTYIINRSKLEEILDFAHRTSQFFTLNDVINYICTSLEVDTYQYHGFLRCFDTLNNYFKNSLSMLDLNNLNSLTDVSWPISTKTHDSPPAKYLTNAEVKNSIISNGCIIDGKIENSIICRRVKIGKNTYIKNCIIFSNSIIADNVTLENVIIDKYGKVLYTKELKGSYEKPIYIKQGDTI